MRFSLINDDIFMRGQQKKHGWMWCKNCILHPDFIVNVKVLINKYKNTTTFCKYIFDNTLFKIYTFVYEIFNMVILLQYLQTLLPTLNSDKKNC